MDKNYQITEKTKVFEFQLNTIYSLIRIKDILLKALEEKWDDESTNPFYHFNELYVRDADGNKFAIGNSLYRIDFSSTFPSYTMRITVMQLDHVDDNSLIDFITTLFRMVNDTTTNDADKVKKGNMERFFFRTVEFGYVLNVDDSIFEEKRLFTHPLMVEYPNMYQIESKYEALLESDFLDGLHLNIMYKRDYDKNTDYLCTKIAAMYKGTVPGQLNKKRFPVKEQLYLVEDVTKELLARAATFKTELEMKINDK